MLTPEQLKEALNVVGVLADNIDLTFEQLEVDIENEINARMLDCAHGSVQHAPVTPRQVAE